MARLVSNGASVCALAGLARECAYAHCTAHRRMQFPPVSVCRCCVALRRRIRTSSGSAVVRARPVSARAVEDREDLRLEFVQNPAVVLRPRCSGRSGPLPVSKRCQRLAIVFADLRGTSGRERTADVFPARAAGTGSRRRRYLTPSLLRTICFAPSARIAERENDGAEVCTAEGTTCTNMYVT